MLVVIYIIQLTTTQYVWEQTMLHNADQNRGYIMEEDVKYLCEQNQLSREEYGFYTYKINEDTMTLKPYLSEPANFVGTGETEILVHTNLSFFNGEPVYHHPLLKELMESHEDPLDELLESLEIKN